MKTKADYIEFKNEIRLRGIQHLIHFTPTINLLSVYEQKKLLSRAKLEEFNIEQTDIFDYIEFTDSIRYDDKNYINLSIEHPNSFLLRRFMEKTYPNMYIKWCVLKIDSKYIYHSDTLFSLTNAANGHNKRNVGITGDLRKFEMMFSENLNIVNSYGSRNLIRGTLKDKYPTDEQAEVLVKDEIPITDVIEICFINENDLAEARAAMYQYDPSKFKVDHKIFLNKRN